jgi:hypothetical protein
MKLLLGMRWAEEQADAVMYSGVLSLYLSHC